MAWIEVFFQTAAQDQTFYEDWLISHGSLAVTYAYTDLDDVALWEPDPDTLPIGTAEMVGLFEDTPETIAWVTAMQAQYPERAIQMRKLEETDWLRACQKDFQAKKFGTRLWVCPSWDTPPDPSAIVLRLDPGIAFGTGAHPTTHLCLEALDALDLKDATILDYGCGSGILAIAACLLGAKEAWAIDHCTQALSSTQENALHNDLSSKIYTGLPAALPENFQATVVCANILAGPLVELAPILLQHTRPGGRLILSGFLPEQLPQLHQAYNTACMRTLLRQSEDWCCLEIELV